MFAKLSAEKGSSNDCHAIKKAKSKKTKKWNLLNFNNEKFNLPCSSYAKFIGVKSTVSCVECEVEN